MPEYVHLTLRFHLEGKQWVGVCLELGTSVFAPTLAECQTELEELITDHINVLEDVGERERFFAKWGIETHPGLCLTNSPSPFPTTSGRDAPSSSHSHARPLCQSNSTWARLRCQTSPP